MKSFEKACEGAAHSRRVQSHVAFLDGLWCSYCVPNGCTPTGPGPVNGIAAQGCPLNRGSVGTTMTKLSPEFSLLNSG
jgi:hypothetical protein